MRFDWNTGAAGSALLPSADRRGDPPQTLKDGGIDGGPLLGEGCLDRPVRLGLQPAPMAILSQMGPHQGRTVGIQLAIQICLQDPQHMPTGGPVSSAAPPCSHHISPHGNRPDWPRRSRMRDRPRCRRLITVPAGIPSAWAASA